METKQELWPGAACMYTCMMDCHLIPSYNCTLICFTNRGDISTEKVLAGQSWADSQRQHIKGLYGSAVRINEKHCSALFLRHVPPQGAASLRRSSQLWSTRSASWRNGMSEEMGRFRSSVRGSRFCPSCIFFFNYFHLFCCLIGFLSGPPVWPHLTVRCRDVSCVQRGWSHLVQNEACCSYVPSSWFILFKGRRELKPDPASQGNMLNLEVGPVQKND